MFMKNIFVHLGRGEITYIERQREIGKHQKHFFIEIYCLNNKFNDLGQQRALIQPSKMLIYPAY